MDLNFNGYRNINLTTKTKHIPFITFLKYIIAINLSFSQQANTPAPQYNIENTKLFAIPISNIWILKVQVTNPKFESIQSCLPGNLLNGNDIQASDVLLQYHHALEMWRSKRALMYENIIGPRVPIGNQELKILNNPEATPDAKAKAKAELDETANMIKQSYNESLASLIVLLAIDHHRVALVRVSSSH